MKNWNGNGNSIYKTLGASNHTSKNREQHDYYATDPKAGELLLELENFDNILEPACGEGHLSKVFVDKGLKVTSSDLIKRGYGTERSFFDYEKWNGDIITNPPYKFAQKFVEHALSITENGNKIAMFLKLQFLESKGRKKLFVDTPPKTLYVTSSRLLCAKNADFEGMRKGGGSAVAYGWFIWEKGFVGNTEIKWFN
jgi:hypothetical protein